MDDKGWVASDSLVNRFDSKRPGGASLLSVALAVDNIDKFDSEYFNIISDMIDKHTIRVPYPIIKNHHINKWSPEWGVEEVRKEIGEKILQIDALETIQITETYLEPKWVDIYRDDKYNHRRINAQKLLTGPLSSYYNIVSIWKYFNEDGNRPVATRNNVLTDDFTGKRFSMWKEIGQQSNRINVVPNGDQTYPLLSASDIVMGYIRQEIYPLFENKIYRELRDFYRNSSSEVWVDSRSISDDNDYEFERLIPNLDEPISRAQYYPKPTIYIERGNVGKDEFETMDLFSLACKYAQINQGCVKSFNENSDGPYIRPGDILVHLNQNPSKISKYLNLNKDVKLLGPDDALDHFSEGIDSSIE